MTQAESGMDNRVLSDLLGRKVVQTVSRSKRPHDSPPQRASKSAPPEKCFFCPGNEHLTPPEIDRIERDGKWEVRCFPNKFPAFAQDSSRAYGRHEIIVETPDHQKTLSELSEDNLCDYLSMLSRRMQDAKKDSRLKYACVFKNEGRNAGASLEHTHSQLAGMDFVPKHVQKIAKKAAAFQKLAEGAKNSFYQNEYFASLCPKGSRFQHEFWILPKFPAHSLDALSEEQLRSLAQALKASLGALDAVTGFAPYNILFHSAPHGQTAFPFHLQVLPRIANWAGFEFATEIVMTSSVPKESAKLLAAAIK